MKAVFLDSINDIEAMKWDQVVNSDYPFLRHDLLAAMENSASACTKTGWQPQHLIVYDSDRQSSIIAVMPLYLKSHSYGEYIFDWGWANAYQRHELEYYPKLLSAIPFTPATGERLSTITGIDRTQLFPFVASALKTRAEQLNASSIHILLPNTDETESWQQQNLTQRTTVQYHWFNESYKNFDHFLESFSSRKRKNLIKERRRISEQGVTLHHYIGDDIGIDLWDIFYDFYQITYAKRSGHGGYLRREFFDLIHQAMSQQILLVMAKYQGRFVAGALYFVSEKTLYGRYWGCTEEFEMLHFEACYYQGIEFCIRNGIEKFDAGAQGEHKIQRGFKPSIIWSNHWIKDQQFAVAIDDFITRERAENARYMEQAAEYLPFKKG